MMKAKWFVGIAEGAKRDLVSAIEAPTSTTHGKDYLCAVGPFKTKRGALFFRDYGRGNPHCVCVDDAEKLARLEAIGKLK